MFGKMEIIYYRYLNFSQVLCFLSYSLKNHISLGDCPKGGRLGPSFTFLSSFLDGKKKKNCYEEERMDGLMCVFLNKL